MIYIITLVLVVFWKFIGVSNNVANDFSYLSKPELISRFTLPQIWQERISEGFGQYVLLILWNWPMDLLYGLLGKIGIAFSLIQILVFLLPFVFIGYYSFKRFVNYFEIEGVKEKIGILFYLINPYVILLIDGGQLSIALAYILIPAVFVSFLRGVDGDFRSKLVAGLFFAGLGFLDIRYLYLLAILLIVYFVYEMFGSKKSIFIQIQSWFYTILAISIVFGILNAYWIIPSIFSRTPTLPEGYSNVSQVTNLSFTNWKHAVLLHPSGWYKNVFGNVMSLNKEFVLVPVFVLLGFIIGIKKKSTYFFVSLTLLGIFLVKGSNVPFSGVYPYLFEHIPGFSLFRDSTKFFVFIALGYSYFIGLLIDKIHINNKSKVVSLVTTGFIICYLLFLVRPVWLGQMTGMFSKPVNEQGFKEVWNKLENDNDFGRVLWLPAQPPLGYSSPSHPSIEGVRLFSKRPFAPGVVGSYESFNFLREAPYMGELFDVLGIKYIAYPFPDTRREELKQDNVDYYHAFLDQLTNLPWVENRVTDSPVPLLKVKNSQDKFFVADNTYAIAGSDSVYENFGEGKSGILKDTVLIFAEESTGLVSDLPDHTKYILNDKQELDLIMTKVPKSNFIFPAQKLPSSPTENGWFDNHFVGAFWKRESIDFLWTRNFLQQKYGIDNTDFDYGEGIAFSEGENALQISDSKIRRGNSLYVRVLVSSKGGLVEFYQGNIKIGEVNAKNETPEKVEIKLTGYKEVPDQFFEYDKADFKWFEVGGLVEEGKIEIRTQGEINIVNALVSISPDEFKSIEKDSNDTYQYSILISDNQFSDQERTIPTITYERIAPTYYKVSVSGLTKPSTLVFSETYDPLWRIYDHDGNEGKPYKLYSLINGFNVEKDGEYDVYFTPQKFVNYGLAVSILGFVGIGSYFLYRPGPQNGGSSKRS